MYLSCFVAVVIYLVRTRRYAGAKEKLKEQMKQQQIFSNKRVSGRHLEELTRKKTTKLKDVIRQLTTFCPSQNCRPTRPYHTYIHTYTHTYISTYLPTYLHTYIQTDRHTYIHTYLPTYLQTDRQTDIHTYIHTYIELYFISDFE